MSLEGAFASVGNMQSWPVTPFESVLTQRKEVGRPELPTLGVSLARGMTKREADDGRPAASLDQSSYKVVYPGDIIMNALGKPHGSIGASTELGITSPAYWVLKVDPQQGEPRFFHYLLRSDHAINEYKRLGKYLPPNQFDLSWELFRNIEFPLPPIEEQRRIADFLDDQVGRIDQAVALRKEQLKLANQIDISRSHILLTRGLSNANQAAHPSESWIESIPIEWKAPQLARLASFRAGAFIQAEDISEEGPYPVYGANGLRGYGAEFSNEGLTVLIGRQGALCGNVTLVDGKFWASEHALVCYPNVEFSLTWFSHALRAMDLGQYSVSAAQPGISVERINSLQIPLPPLKEQLEIAQVLGDFTRAHQVARGLLDRSVIHLEERRRSLITAAVSGQLDVTSVRPLTSSWVSVTHSTNIDSTPESVGMSL